MTIELAAVFVGIIGALGGALWLSSGSNKRMAESNRVSAESNKVSAEAARVASEALGKQTETNIKLNDELQETIRARRAGEKERQDLTLKVCQIEADMVQMKADHQAEIARMEANHQAEIIQLRAESQKAIDQLGTELVKVRQEALIMKDSIRDLTAALKAAQEQLKTNELQQAQWKTELAEAKRQIAELQRDNAELQRDKFAKDSEIKSLQSRVKELERKLQESEDARALSEAREKDLLQQLAALDAEPGEHNTTEQPETNESSEETKQDG